MLSICRVVLILSILEFFGGNGELDPNESAIEDLERKANILKKRIDLLQDFGDGKLELVFLIDASSSVGSSNFKSELKFVKKLLASFDVAYNNTRVSIITFSDTTKVIRHVDHISINSDENHKCGLLHSDLPSIPYSSGGTYTLGALLDAQSVLLSSRRDAIKAVFLVTDGFSNGGDPLPVAEILKEGGAFLFTFGIHNGKTEELEKIASAPIEDHTYLLQSFDQFEQLARRALHKDLSVSRFQLVNNRSLCDKLCEEEYRDPKYGCCDEEANCACGTQSGHYACVCGPGHYGSGLAGSCLPCPNGTYHDGSQSGDISICQVCPDVNQYTEIGTAASKKDCKCKQGFVSNGDKCEVLTCSPLEAPVHGYFVQGGACPVAVYAACGIRCDVGYALQGTSIRLCEDTGEWSGDAPMCKAKTCPNLKSPVNGTMNCTEPVDLLSNKINPDARAVDTECKFKCESGYNLIGSHRRHCLPLARWDGLPVSCKPITCPPLTPPPHGLMTPDICHRRVPFGTECTLKCSPGYKIEGVATRKCTGKGGKWTQKSVSSKCVDVSPPRITCPENVSASTDIGSKFATVSWDRPVCEDNSGKEPLVWSETAASIPVILPIGFTNVTYFALDASGNEANCTFVVTVIDDEPPTIDFCPTPDPIHLYETGGNATVVWTEPTFFDNSEATPKVFKSHSPGAFPVGSTRVTYMATDEAGNNSTCTFDVIVRDSLCSEVPPKPTFGNTTCVIVDDKIKNCSITCFESYILTVNDTIRLRLKEGLNYSCSENKTQLTSLPECAETAFPNSISQDGTMYLALSPLCKNMSDFDKISNEVKTLIESKLEEVCESFDETTCVVQNINARCEESVSAKEEETNELFSGRRRRSVQTQPQNSASNVDAKSGNQSRIRADFRIEFHRNPSATMNTTFGTDEFEALRLRLSNRIPNLAWTGDAEVFCRPGFVFLPGGSCVQCPRGSFADRGSHICQPCPWGQYQDLPGQISCLPCPEGTSTRSEYSRQRSDCRSICRPGTYGRRVYPGMPSVAPCQSCERGWYQPEMGASSCIQCPAGVMGSKTAATNVQECGQLPVSSTKCGNGFCLNNGNCSQDSTNVRLKCDCFPGFIGPRCLSPPNPCDSSPCIHGGSCVLTSFSNYSCVCPPGFTGVICQTDVDECASSPCQNNGTCEDLLNSFFCDCPIGFRGERCEVNIDECSVNPCSNNSVCVDGIGSYRCVCSPGYTGKHCDVPPVDVCREIQPCRNRGRCMNTADGNYTCVCSSGWTGQNCELVTNHCDDHPCQNGGICESEGNRCSSESCVYCWCHRGYSGQYCEIKNNPDYYLRFPFSGTTDFASVRVPPGMYDEVSLCLWLKSDDGFNYGTSFSYATSTQPNSFTLTDYNGLVLYVSGSNVVTDLVINDGLWHHICVTWRSSDGLWKIYLDGNCKSNGTHLASNATIQGEGQLVVGQEQDSVGGSFNAAESLVGYIYGLEMWSKMLDAQIIDNLANNCQPGQSGDLVTWADVRSGLHGKVEVEPSRFCSACPDPDPPIHGNVTVLNTGKGLVARYVCREGFVVQGSTTGTFDRICIKGSHWQGLVPTCVRRSCPRPKPLLGGSIEIHGGYLYEDIVSYKCREGYTLLGSESRVCLADGTWSGDDALCKGLPCPPVAAPIHGTVSSFGTATQKLLFSCEPGFRLYGPSSVSCLHDGSWDEIAPECIPDQTMCEDMPRVENAIIRRLDQAPNQVEKAQVLCNNVEIAEFECLSTGIWSVVGGTEPVCRSLAGCTLPSAPPNSTIISSVVAENDFVSDGSTISVKCGEGYVLDGPSLKTCADGNFLPSDSWSCELACNPVDLPHDVPFSTVVTSGSRAVLKCTDGYELLLGGPGSSKIQDNITWNCLSSGEWVMSSGEFSSSGEVEYVGCRRKIIAKHCPQPKVPVHGILSWSSDGEQALSVGESIRLHCEPGYVPMGKTVFSCTEEGVWSGVDNASCQPRTCGPLTGPVHTLPSGPARVGDLIILRCEKGYKPVGDLVAKCLPNTYWSSPSGFCTPISCGSPHIPAGSKASESSYLYGSSVTVTCPAGFVPTIPQVIVCLHNGLWSGMPSCNPFY